MIPVTRPVLPALEDYVAHLEGVWERAWVTNDGPLAQQLEAELAERLGVRHVILVSNGTIAIQLLVKALGIEGDVITTPFSYVATTSALVWEGCRPVFADVEPEGLGLDAASVRGRMTGATRAILATHVYGIPCDVEGLAAAAAERGIPVLYDAAHAFGASYLGKSLASYGTAATLSFHATKLFHTVEGGAVVTEDAELARTIRYMRSFGHDGPDDYRGVGINAKLSELHAAMGLCLLPRLPGIQAERAEIVAAYDRLLAGTDVTRPASRPGAVPNHAYYPLLLRAPALVQAAIAALEAEGIRGRRYFHPPLNRLPYVDGVPCPVAEDAATRVLCLPLYPGLAPAVVQRAGEIVAGIADG